MDIHRRFTIFSLIIGVLLTIYPSYGFAGARVSSYEEKLLLHINQHRIAKGLNPLAMDESLHGWLNATACIWRKKMC